MRGLMIPDSRCKACSNGQAGRLQGGRSPQEWVSPSRPGPRGSKPFPKTRPRAFNMARESVDIPPALWQHAPVAVDGTTTGLRLTAAAQFIARQVQKICCIAAPTRTSD
jgi:hypothetical protein